MKTLYIIGPAHPYRGGIASSNQILARTFQNRGVEVRMLNFSLQYPSFLFPGRSQYSDSPAPDDLNITRIVNSVNPLNWIKVGLMIARQKPDAVIVRYWIPLMSPCLGTICRLARRNGHTNVIALADNIVPHEHRPFDKMLTRYFINSVDGFVYMSAQVKAELDLFGSTKPAVFSPHPIYDSYGDKVSKNLACSKLSLDPAMSYTLFFGFIRDYKGVDILIEAWSKIDRRGRKLIIAGEYYNNKEQLMQMIVGLDIQDDVIIRDYFIGDDEVRYYFSAADLVVQPYKSATQSGVTQVAYHFDVPMVVTNVGGLAEIVTDGKVGRVVEPNADAVAAAMSDFYDNNRHDEFVSNMEKEKQRFSWSAMVDKFVDLLHTIRRIDMDKVMNR